MASGVNKAILVGNLGADPELRYTNGGTAVCELRLATNESYKDREGNRKESTEWHRVIVWDKRAEVVSKHLAKGRQVYVEARSEPARGKTGRGASGRRQRSSLRMSSFCRAAANNPANPKAAEVGRRMNRGRTRIFRS